jgi:hypothetical protein
MELVSIICDYGHNNVRVYMLVSSVIYVMSRYVIYGFSSGFECEGSLKLAAILY